jgi:hypothetical protein
MTFPDDEADRLRHAINVYRAKVEREHGPGEHVICTAVMRDAQFTLGEAPEGWVPRRDRTVRSAIGEVYGELAVECSAVLSFERGETRRAKYLRGERQAAELLGIPYAQLMTWRRA